MPYTLTYNEEEHYILADMEGLLDMETFGNYAQDAARLTREKNCYNILYDLRGTSHNLSTTDIYGLQKISRETGLDHDYRRAVVVESQNRDYDFFETVYRNRGHQFQFFTSRKDALKWLLNNNTG